MESNKEKQNIRKEIRKKLEALGFDSILQQSQKVISNLEKDKIFQKADKVFSYISKSDEVFTHDLIKELLAKGKVVVVPKVQSDKICFKRLLNWETDLEEGPFGLIEPKEHLETVEPSYRLDIYLIPGRAFDSNGFRLGRGMGLFDRLLAQIELKQELVGLALEEQLVSSLPKEAHDIPMNRIITDKQILIIQGS